MTSPTSCPSASSEFCTSVLHACELIECSPPPFTERATSEAKSVTPPLIWNPNWLRLNVASHQTCLLWNPNRLRPNRARLSLGLHTTSPKIQTQSSKPEAHPVEMVSSAHLTTTAPATPGPPDADKSASPPAPRTSSIHQLRPHTPSNTYPHTHTRTGAQDCLSDPRAPKQSLLAGRRLPSGPRPHHQKPRKLQCRVWPSQKQFLLLACSSRLLLPLTPYGTN